MYQALIPLLFFFQAPAAATQAPAGAAPDWDQRPRIEKLGKDLAMLKPVLDRIDPGTWTVEGGPEAYQRQHKACLQDLSNVQNAIARWAAQPDRLSLMLETLVRIENLNLQAVSLSQGIRRYQNPAIADLLDSVLASLAGGLDWLRSQSLEMAQQREKELDVALKEAQRCRTQLLPPRPRD